MSAFLQNVRDLVTSHQRGDITADQLAHYLQRELDFLYQAGIIPRPS